MIKLTDAAVEQIKKSAGENGLQDIPLRIAAKRLEHGAIEYAMGHDEAAELDTTSEYDGVTLVVAPHSMDLLSGAVLDFVELQDGVPQFIFLNPNDPEYIPPSEED